MTSAWGDPTTRRAVLIAAAGGLLAACARPARRTATATAPPVTAPSTAPSTARSPATTHPAASPPGARVVRSASTGRAQVALTFHGSGDPSLAISLLDEAERAGAGLTVFAVGTWLDQHPEMARRVLRGGHALGNHTYTHPTLHRLSPAAINTEVAKCAAVLRRLTGSPGAGFRPSGGPQVTEPMVAAATASGYSVVVGYDVDSLDNTDPGASAVTARVLSEVRPGSIVSLHLGHAGTVQALPHILSGLASRHLQPVTVPQLLAP